MSLVLNKADFKGMMELEGGIEFEPGKIVVIYGSNQQGKTNIINAVRYAFLSDFKKKGSKKEYDDRSIPSRKELIFDTDASIGVIFQHNNIPYHLQRKISGKGKREESILYESNNPSQKLDVKEFLTGKLKVSLLDVLFSPEISEGFKQLYGGTLDQSIAEMFKEITTLRRIVTRFIDRMNSIKKKAQMEIKLIEENYTDFFNELVKTFPQVISFEDFEKLKKFEPGKTSRKIDDFSGTLQRYIDKLKEETLVGEIDTANEKADELSELKAEIENNQKIKKNFQQLMIIKKDHTELKEWLNIIHKITKVEQEAKKPPTLSDSQINLQVNQIFSTLIDAKTSHKRAIEISTKNKVELESVEKRIKELSSIVRILEKRTTIGKQIMISLTKIQGKPHAVLPIKLLAKDSTLREISKEPLPKGTIKERNRYLKSLKELIAKLKKIQRLENDSQKKFDLFLDKGIDDLGELESSLEKKHTSLKVNVETWASQLASSSSSFIGRTILPAKLEEISDVDKLVNKLNPLILAEEKKYVERLNGSLKPLNVQVKVLNTSEIKQIENTVKQQKKELPTIESLKETIEEKKQEFHDEEQTYSDYLLMPQLADETISILQKISEKCFDESKLKQLIAETHNEIILTIKDRNLIQATTEISPDEIRGKTMYKEKEITHPAGSEKAFFSLAILTALAHYFRMPVLIDEVANNLDTKNMKAFFQLVNEFKTRWTVQYVLSVKETRDFDLEGWVRDMHENLAVHEIKDKTIERINLQ